MNIQQIEYIITLDKLRHFARAAEKCHVTQPTLSMMIQKLEDELDIKIFDRSKQPVIPTPAGLRILEQAKKVMAEYSALHEIAQEEKGILAGELHLAVIPTIAPYLLPAFVSEFVKYHPNIKLHLTEMMTGEMIQALKEDRIDGGILVTPIADKNIHHTPLYYEPFWAYIGKQHPLFKKKVIKAKDFNNENVLLLKEGHCMRGQILNICSLREKSVETFGFSYDSGSLEALKNIVDHQGGVTILPELATTHLNKIQLRSFDDPQPSRQVSFVTHRTYHKVRLIQTAIEFILRSVPEKMHVKKSKKIIPTTF